MQRKIFLQQFLGALGAKKIEWNQENHDFVSGKVLYELDNPEEAQEFIWRVSEADIPSKEVALLAELLNEQQLLCIDQISVPREELRTLFSKKLGRITTEAELLSILKALELIEVPMVDDGEETDIFFIHE